MNKKTLIETLHVQQKKRGFSKAAIGDFVDSFIDQMSYIMKRHKKISHPSIGVFKVVKRAAMRGRNPKTGQSIDVPARKKISFRPSSKVKLTLNAE